MRDKDPSRPSFPMCKLAEYSVTASSVRRRSLVKTQIKLSVEPNGRRRWWYQEAKGDIRKFFLNPTATRRQLRAASDRLRDAAATEKDDQKRKGLLASARAVEAFSPISEEARLAGVITTPGRRENAEMLRSNVRVIVAPDLLFVEKGTEAVVGALKIHASQEYKLNREALLNAASILFAYLEERGEQPQRDYCSVIDVFTPASELAPRGVARRMGGSPRGLDTRGSRKASRLGSA